MSAKIMWSAAIFFGGWLWSYVFIRQIMFNFLIANPLIKKLRAMQQDLIAVPSLSVLNDLLSEADR